ncbi:T9SS type A sorting domain-containing protein [Chryseobacterium arthrosphaerae]|uniref:T9SS type A sorting domain-containing protein n=1 Tax=Chryseobacterium arthrosphaerae TaxID=651561 RepID=UPI001BAEF65C|nr:T9SS type A sorting domain-containing protein [Chryseobacterium arthrosphaerae]QUY57666.1 T9SS type A sorting domain-containing protein [Chryseobacterium arthrosphaerae]UEQ77536.1 T9SS type A sorting domain-containing protein [Chryseobacterium arthrosphaerae]WES99083.1 T9SS type A sorting domain-containing protein [Chryseobacterium arthrosphaerae]
MKKTLLLAACMAANFFLSQTYMNGGLSTGATSKSGAAAPAGYTWSELQNNTGNTTETNTSLGLGGTFISTASSLFLADDFTIPAGSNWQITSIDFFAYQTGYTGTTAPFNTARVNIYSSDPSVAGAVSVFGDDTTNRFSAGADGGMYRIGNSSVPTPVTSPLTNRKVWKITANTPVTLGPGTYWVKYQLQNVVQASGGFFPPVTIADTRGLSSFNAKQFNAVAGTWISIIDDGLPATAPDYPLDMPFVITYTSVSLGTKETMQYDNRVQVYPNPVKDHFKINNPERMKISTVDIIDVSGKVIRTMQGSQEYSVSDLPTGNYMLKIYNDGGPAKVTKLIKQ